MFDPTKGDPTEGRGIPTTSIDVEPVNPDKLREMTGARGLEAYIDIDITGKRILRRNTKAGHKEIVVLESIRPEDIRNSGRVQKSTYDSVDD